MSLAPPPLQTWRDMPPVWARWFQALFARVGGSVVGGSTDVILAPLASPALTGTPTAPTAGADTNTTQIATAAFVLGQASGATPAMDGAAAAGTSTRYARADHVHPTDTSRAPLESPTFTGTPAAPTAAAGISTTQIATTEFVATALTPPAWTAPTLLNSWANYGSGTAPAGYFKDSAGIVWLRGVVAGGSPAASVVLTMPAGYRPAYLLVFNQQTNPGGAAARVDVDASGNVTASAGVSATWLSLDGIAFRAEA